MDKILTLVFTLIFQLATLTINKYIPKKNVPTPTLLKGYYRVLKVIDGDTINVEIDGKSFPVRLIGINSPELKDPRKPVECFAKEASEKANQVLAEKNVKLENDPTQTDKDKYDRLLRYVFLEDGINFNKMMIEEGFAFEYTYSNPYKYQDEFKLAQKNAEENKRGLWADNACIKD